MDKRAKALQIITSIAGDSDAHLWETVVDALIAEGVITGNFGNVDVNAVVDAFKSCYGTTRVSKYDRFSATRLIKVYGSTAVVQVIKAMSASQGDRFAPVLNNISQLEEKWVSVINYLKKKHSANISTMDI